MDLFSSIIAAEVIGTVVYTFLGIILMWLIWKAIDWMTPFPIMKEIEDDQNIALAILIGLVFVSISIVIAAVIIS